MNYNFDDYLSVVKQNIKNEKLHAPICAELESHLKDSADFYVEIGYDEETANRKALEDMGEPSIVGEDMAKLHNLSYRQKFLFVIFMIMAVSKILDLIIANAMITDWMSEIIFIFQSESAVMLSCELIPLLFTVTTGIAITLYTKRKAPAIAALVILALEITSIWCFSGVLWMTAKGTLDEYLTEKVFMTSVDCIVSALFTVLIFSALLVPLICVIRTVGRPFSDSRTVSKIVKIFAALVALVLTTVHIGIIAYVDNKDKEQFELYTRVVADMCDLCMEKGRITADDFEEVKERFDYLEIKKIDLNDYNIEHYSAYNVYKANIGDGFMINSYLELTTYSDGSFAFSADADRLMYSFDLNLRYFKTSRDLNWNNRWEGSYDVASFIGDFLDNAQPGDNLDSYLMKVKEAGSHFAYHYDADGVDDYYIISGTLGSDDLKYGNKTADGAVEYYSSYLDMSGFFGRWYYDIFADDGKFVSAEEMID